MDWLRSATRRYLNLALAAVTFVLPGAAAEYSRRIWRSEDGLPQNRVQAISQTRDGYLWIGTSGGLVRFDGVRFVVFDRLNTPALRDDSILSLCPAADGSLWIGTEGGGLVNMKNGAFRNFFEKEGLTNGFVRALLEDRRGVLWVGTDRGFFRHKGGRLVRLDAKADAPVLPVRSVFEDRSGVVWAGTSIGLFRMNGDRPVRAGEPDDTGFVASIFQSRDGVMWLGEESGVERMLGGRRERDPRLTSMTVQQMTEDRDGNLWMGTLGQGLLRLSGKEVATYRAPETMPDNTVLAVFEDRERNLWIGTQDGLLRLTQSVVTTVTARDGLAGDSVSTVYRDQAGELWIGAGGRLHTLKNGRPEEYRIPAPHGDFEARNIFVDSKGVRWLGSLRQGALRVSRDRSTAFTMQDGLRSNDIRDFIEDRSGAVWMATGSGLTRWYAGSVKTYYVEDGLAYGSTRALALDEAGDVLVGTDGGLNRVHNGKIVPDAVFASLGRERIWSIRISRDGSLWLGTRGNGLVRIRDGRVARYTTRDGLPSNVIYDIVEDANGRLWMSSSVGIFSAGIAELNAVAAGRPGPVAMIPIGMGEGLLSSQMSGGAQSAGCISPSGEIWFASVKGAVRIRPDRLRRTPPAPVLVESMSLDGQPLPLTGDIAIPPGRGKLEIDYTAPNLLSPNRVVFSYKLEPFDDEWTISPRGRAAYYTNLPPRRYTFHVIARDGVDPARTSEATLTFTLKPHFYETVWFYASLALLLGLGTWSALRLYARQTRARYALVLAERARLAREMHDTLIQGCVGISTLLEAARSMPEPSTRQMRELLDRAAIQARTTVDEAREAVWDLRHSDLEHDLSETLKDFARQITASEGIPVRAQVEGTPGPLEEETDRNLLLVAREAIRNAVMHANPGEIDVRLRYEPGEVSLEVSDNGAGFTPEAARDNGHYGIMGMKERVEQSGGSFQVRSGLGRGTRVTVRLPLRPARKNIDRLKDR